MKTSRPRAITAGILALVLGPVAALAAAVPASADDLFLHPGDIRADATTYLGWHESLPNSTPAFYIGWEGVHLGVGTSSRLIDGLVAVGSPGIATSAAGIESLLVDNSFLGINEGEVRWQVEVTTTAGVTTIESVDPATVATSGAVTLTDLWTTTSTIGSLVGGAPLAFGDLMDALQAQGDLRYTGYGIRADAATPAGAAVVQTIALGDDQWNIGIDSDLVPPTVTVPVDGNDIKPPTAAAIGWREDLSNATPAYEVQPDGLHLGTVADSRIINWFAHSESNANLLSLSISSLFSATTTGAHMVLPVTFGPQSTRALLAGADPIPAGGDFPSLMDNWTSSVAIPATPLIPAIAAADAVQLGDLMDALAAQGPLVVLGVGVSAPAGGGAVLASIQWNGTTYTFVPAAVPAPQRPALANTGPTPNPVMIWVAVFLLIAGIAALAGRASARRNRSPIE